MMRVISSPSSSTTVPFTVIFDICQCLSDDDFLVSRYAGAVSPHWLPLVSGYDAIHRTLRDHG